MSLHDEWRTWLCFFCWLAAASVSILIVTLIGNAPIAPKAQICKLEDARTKHLRARLGQPNGFQKCAIVGSASKILRHPRLGKEIDSHDFIVRANLAPVGGFEAFVGAKTHLRVLNTEAFNAALMENTCPSVAARKNISTFCPRYAIFANMPSASVQHQVLRQACGSSLGPLLTWADLDSYDPALRAMWPGRSYPMSGAWAIALALRVCPNGATLFGYTHKREWANASRTPYHYYDARSVRRHFDNLPRSAQLLAAFVANQKSCLRFASSMATGAGVASPATRRSRKSPVDPFVAPVPHTHPASHYATLPKHLLDSADAQRCSRPALMMTAGDEGVWA